MGDRLFGTLIAGALAATRPEVSCVLSRARNQLAGERWELALIDTLPEVLHALIEPAVVAEWNKYHVIWPERIETVRSRIVLLDAAHLDLDAKAAPGDASWIECDRGPAVSHATVGRGERSTEARTIVDLTDLLDIDTLQRRDVTTLVDTHRRHGLDAPILADFCARGADWDYAQIVPHDGSRVSIRQAKLLLPSRSEIRADTTKPAMERTLRVPQRAHWAAQLAVAFTRLPTMDQNAVQELCRRQFAAMAAEVVHFASALNRPA